MVRTANRDMILVNSLDEIPVFQTEAEEHEFWSTHDFSEHALEQMEPLSAEELALLPPVRLRPVELHLDRRTVARLRALATRNGTGLKTLIKQFVAERLYEEEQRVGLIPPRPDAETAAPRRSRRSRAAPDASETSEGTRAG